MDAAADASVEPEPVVVVSFGGFEEEAAVFFGFDADGDPSKPDTGGGNGVTK